MSAEVPNSQSEKQNDLKIFIEDGEDGIQFLTVPELSKRIPIYDFRNLDHQVLAARAIASESRMAMFGGVWGGFKGVKRNTIGERFFLQAKPGRPAEAKIPLMIAPEDAIQLIDWLKVHQDLRFLHNYWNFKKLWTSHVAFLHIIAPVRPTTYSFPDIFKTTPSEFQTRYPGVEPISTTTAAFVWREEPYLRHFGSLVKRFSHTQVYIGVSTLNPHGKEPPYFFDELLQQLARGETPVEAIDLIIQDPLYEKYRAFGSHTQIRLPLIGEEPCFKVLRIGSLSPESFEKATGFEWKVIPGAQDVRKNPGETLEEKLAEMMAEINNQWQKVKPLIYFRT